MNANISFYKIQGTNKRKCPNAKHVLTTETSGHTFANTYNVLENVGHTLERVTGSVLSKVLSLSNYIKQIKLTHKYEIIS